MDKKDIQKAQQTAQVAQAAVAMGPGGWAAIAAGCGCLLIVILFAGTVALGVFAINNEGGMTGGASERIGFYGPEGLSSIVPPNFASLFTEAGKHTGVDPALIAAIFLTEKHTDSFGADLPSLDHELMPCTENSSGAAGPMQFITSSWNGVTDDLTRVGITSPNRCKYRDSIIGAAFLLKGKLSFGWVQDACDSKNPSQVSYTDTCVSRWGQSYCGVPISGREGTTGCNHRACGAPNYLYCEEVVRKFKLVKKGS